MSGTVEDERNELLDQQEEEAIRRAAHRPTTLINGMEPCPSCKGACWVCTKGHGPGEEHWGCISECSVCHAWGWVRPGATGPSRTDT